MTTTMAVRREVRRGSRAMPAAAPTTTGPSHLLTAEEELALALRKKAGDRAAREELIVANLPLVIHVASHFESSGMTRGDLIQEGIVGLMRAAEKFDPQAHEARFSTYAVYWITQAIQRAMARSGVIRVPDYLWRLQNRYRRVMNQIRSEEYECATASLPGPEGLAERMGISLRRMKLLDQSRLGQALPQEEEEGEEVTIDSLAADPSSPEQELEEAEQAQVLRRAVAALPALQAWVIRRRFGLPPRSRRAEPGDERRGGPGREEDDCGYKSLAAQLGVSRDRIKAIEQSALIHLRRMLGEDFDIPATRRWWR
ncbi:MAG: sigma-70 family RNA polymerase sigma factor [Isosphaeraceae bacterium]